MAALGELVISLRGEIAKFEAAMTRAESITKNVTGGINQHVGTVHRTLGALGVGLTFAGLVAFTKSVIDSGDALDELSQKTGVTVEALAGLKYAFEKDGVQVEAMATGMKKLSQNMVAAGDATSKQGRIFAAMGVDISKGIQPALEQIADRFRSLPDGPTKAALAVELFGKAGMDMIPTLNQGSAELKRMREEAEKLGLVMSGETAKSMADFNDNMKAVKGSAQGLVVTVFNDLTPSILRVTGAMKEAAKESGVLKAVWVLLGGVAAEAFGLNDTELQKMQQHFNNLQAQLVKLGESIPDDREQKLRKGLIEPATIAEGEFVRLNRQMIATQALIDGMSGKYDDQVSRRARQGQVLSAPAGGTPGTNTGLSNSIASLLGGGNTTQDWFAQQVTSATTALRQAELATKMWADGNDKLTTSQKALVAVINHPEFKKLPADQKLKLANLLNQAAAQEQYNQDLADAAKYTKELAEWNQRLADEVEEVQMRYERMGIERLQSLQQEVDAMTHENSLIGMSSNARELANLKMREEIALRGVISDEVRDGIKLKFEELRALAQQRQTVEQSITVWQEAAESGSRFFSDLLMNGRSAFDNLKASLKSFLGELIALFAKKWILQMGGNFIGGSAGAALLTQAGNVGQDGSMLGSAFNLVSTVGGSAMGYVGSGITAAGGFIGSNFLTGVGSGISAAANSGIFSSFLAGASNLATGATSAALAVGQMVPVIGLAVGALYLLYNAFKDKGENWKGQIGFGGNAVAYGSDSVFGRQGFSNLQGRDEVNVQIQAFMASTAPIDAILARGMTQEQIGSVQNTLATTPTREFAFPANDETAAEQLTLDFLKTKYGAIFDQVDTKFAAFIRGYKGKAEDLLKEIASFAAMVDSIGGMGIKGFSLSALRNMGKEGETTQQTLQRVAQEWANFNQMFTTEAEALEQATSAVNSVFEELGLAVPADAAAFEALVRGIDTSTEAGAKMLARLLEIDEAFMAVANHQTQAAQRAKDAAREAAESWKGFRDLLVRAAGSNGASLQATFIQGDIIRDSNAFRAANVWAQSLDNMQLFNAFLTMQADDWANYSAENRQLITSIVGSTLALQDLTNAAIEFSGTYGLNSETVRRNREREKLEEEARRREEERADARGSLQQWWQSQLTSDLSPLSRGAKTENLKANYERLLALAQGGDAKAIAELGGASEAYLQSVRKQFKSSGAYNEIWREVMEATGAVAGVTDVNTKLANAMPAGKLASQADVEALSNTVASLVDLISKGISVKDSGVEDALRSLAMKVVPSGSFSGV
jgi:hypothetical protein